MKLNECGGKLCKDLLLIFYMEAEKKTHEVANEYWRKFCRSKCGEKEYQEWLRKHKVYENTLIMHRRVFDLYEKRRGRLNWPKEWVRGT